MGGKPNSIRLSSFFLKEGEEHREAREKIMKAWRHIHMKSRKDLGPRGGYFFRALSSVGTSQSYSIEDVLFLRSTYA